MLDGEELVVGGQPGVQRLPVQGVGQDLRVGGRHRFGSVQPGTRTPAGVGPGNASAGPASFMIVSPDAPAAAAPLRTVRRCSPCVCMGSLPRSSTTMSCTVTLSRAMSREVREACDVRQVARCPRPSGLCLRSQRTASHSGRGRSNHWTSTPPTVLAAHLVERADLAEAEPLGAAGPTRRSAAPPRRTRDARPRRPAPRAARRTAPTRLPCRPCPARSRRWSPPTSRRRAWPDGRCWSRSPRRSPSVSATSNRCGPVSA